MQKRSRKTKAYIRILFIVFIVLSQRSLGQSWSQYFQAIGTFSSPRVSDLNGDGTKDIILGAGKAEFVPSDSAILALDGKTGELLWEVHALDQVFGSACLLDINQDNIDDVIIGGRSAELKAINGRTGEVIWEFLQANPKKELGPWFNFYNAQVLPDQNHDGQRDLLVSNGGDVRVEAYDPNRPTGHLLVLSGKSGKLLAKAEMPDGKEIYQSVIIQATKDGKDHRIVFGTGGETIEGNLYSCLLSDIMRENLNEATLLAKGNGKGFIAPPIWADINGDGQDDIIANSVDGRMLAFDGASLEPIWEVRMPDTEAYSSLAVGYFTDDNVPDLFASVAKGDWPKLDWNKQFMINGANGHIEFVDSLGFYQTSSAVAVDLTGNGRDEILLSVNYQIRDTIERKTFQNMLVAIDFRSKQVIELGAVFPGNNISSTPWIGDLNGNGELDIIYCHGTNPFQTYTFDGLQINRIDTDLAIRGPISWGAYMGNQYDAKFSPKPAAKP